MSTSRNYRIVVPTRDSARWIRTFAQSYREIGVDPLYLYDTRSADHTLDELMGAGAEIVEVTPSHSRVEAMIEFVKDVVDTDWVVRLDDDEFPSVQLIDWLGSSLPDMEAPVLAVSRRDVRFIGEELCYSRFEDYYFNPRDPTYLDPQFRAFRPKDVRFTDTIHAPGFDLQVWDAVPPQAYFIHLDWILRSAGERLEKLRGYERQKAGAGWAYAQYYLPEAHNQEDLRWTRFESRQFDRLARKILASATQ